MITQGILNSRFAQATTSHSRPGGPMVSRNSAANRGAHTAGKIQQPNQNASSGSLRFHLTQSTVLTKSQLNK